jgi:antitoxin component YwqK of YwqJK toxin-antitoxin module
MSTPMNKLEFLDDQTCCLDGSPFTGVAVEFFRDGQTRTELHFVDGMQDGISRDWYETGVLRYEATYRENNLHGPLREWYPSGALKLEAAYEFGIELSFVEWSEDGRQLVQRMLEPGSVQDQLLQKWRGKA